MQPNARMIEMLYTSLRDGNASAAAACYSANARFRDIAFSLDGRKQILDMWSYVCSRKVKVDFDSVVADGQEGRGHWIASYTFHDTGLPVVNNINSEFGFDGDGFIASHIDRCSAMAWAIQAYDFPKCLVAGAIGPLRRYKAREKLDRFLRETGERNAAALAVPR